MDGKNGSSGGGLGAGTGRPKKRHRELNKLFLAEVSERARPSLLVR